MEKTSYSILNKNVLETLIKTFGLRPVVREPNMFSRDTKIKDGIFLHIAIFDHTIDKNNGIWGINQFMSSYHVIISYHGWNIERKVEDFEIFEYEDVRKVIDGVNNFIKTYNPA